MVSYYTSRSEKIKEPPRVQIQLWNFHTAGGFSPGLCFRKGDINKPDPNSLDKHLHVMVIFLACQNVGSIALRDVVINMLYAMPASPSTLLWFQLHF